MEVVLVGGTVEETLFEDVSQAGGERGDVFAQRLNCASSNPEKGEWSDSMACDTNRDCGREIETGEKTLSTPETGAIAVPEMSRRMQGKWHRPLRRFNWSCKVFSDLLSMFRQKR